MKSERLEIFVLTASPVFISKRGVTGCPTGSSAEMTKAWMHLSGAQGPDSSAHCIPAITSPHFRALFPTSVCFHSVFNSPDVLQNAIPWGYLLPIVLEEPGYFSLPNCRTTLILLQAHNSLFIVCLNLLCLASGQNLFFCLEGGWQLAFEEVPKLLFGRPAGSNPAQHSLPSHILLPSFPRNMQPQNNQRLTWSNIPEEGFKQHMKFKHTQGVLELEDTSEDHLDHLLTPRQIQLYLQDAADTYLSDWFLPASSQTVTFLQAN